MRIFYTYYSYEEWGRGYIGCRVCEGSPEGDPYLGSFYDKTFKPTHKIILGVHASHEEALSEEIALHEFFKVDINPHFANQARQTSTKFRFSGPPSEKNIERFREYAIRPRTEEEKGFLRSISAKGLQAAQKAREGVDPELLKEWGRRAYAAQPEDARHRCRVNGGKAASALSRKNKTGIFGIPKETADELRRVNNLTLYRCTITGKISTAPALAKFQRNRGIDPCNRSRLPDNEQHKLNDYYSNK